MAEGSSPNIGDVFNAFGGNPFNAFARTFEQLKKGATDMIAAVELIRSTMENLNSAATRMNRMLDDVEEPIRAAMPQITRAVKLANGIVDQMTGPVERVAPGINRLADTLASPVMTSMPKQLSDFLDAIGDLSRRIAPLTQLAESAGGLLGMRGFTIGALTGRQEGSSAAAPEPPAAATTKAGPAPAPAPAPRKATRTTAKEWASRASTDAPAATSSTATRKAASKATKKTAAKKTAAKKSAAKKVTAKKSATKSTAARKRAATR